MSNISVDENVFRKYLRKKEYSQFSKYAYAAKILKIEAVVANSGVFDSDNLVDIYGEYGVLKRVTYRYYINAGILPGKYWVVYEYCNVVQEAVQSEQWLNDNFDVVVTKDDSVESNCGPSDSDDHARTAKAYITSDGDALLEFTSQDPINEKYYFRSSKINGVLPSKEFPRGCEVLVGSVAYAVIESVEEVLHKLEQFGVF